MPELMRDGLFARIVMEHRDDAGVVVFNSRAWGRLFDTRGPLFRKLILEFLRTLRFGEVLLDLDAPSTIQFQLGGARRRLSWRQFILALGLHTGEEIESLGFARDFLGPPPSYTLIKDPMLRLCHRMMAHIITRRSQALEKVAVTDLFYLRGLDVGSVNIPYILARYLRRFAAERKSGAHISGGQFVARLAKHFGLLTAKILEGLTVITPELLIIDMAELVPLKATTITQLKCRTLPTKGWARLEEDVHEIHGTLAKKREVISAMTRDFSRLCTWTTNSLARMMDRAGVTYTSYSETPREYMRRVRCRTDGASTSTVQQDPQQPDL
ncbi:hypothetical protein Tco_1438348 [Tanacetum coccineum]